MDHLELMMCKHHIGPIGAALLLLWLSAGISAQVSLDRQVLSAFGASSTAGSVALDYTLGEPVVTKLSAPDYLLTQGFHQPSAAAVENLLTWRLEVLPVSCPGAVDGEAFVSGIRGCPPPYEIEWSTGSGGAVARPLPAGLYSVTVRSPNCERTVSFEVPLEEEGNCLLRFYNAFSPNADGVNDVWEIENIQLPQFRDNRVEIFNRWGQRVWAASHYNNSDVAWDGSNAQGIALPHATYFYIAEVNGTTYKGYIELTK